MSRFMHWSYQLEELLFPLRPFERIVNRGQHMLTLVCDDGRIDDTQKIEPLLVRLNVPAVFGIIADRIGTPGYMAERDIQRLVAHGCEIASHTQTHSKLTSLRISDVEYEFATSKSTLSTITNQPIDTLIYPYGLNNRNVRHLASKYFNVAIGTWYGTNRGLSNRFALRRVPFGSYANLGQNSIQFYLHTLDQAIKDHAWMVLMLHAGVKEHDTTQNQYLECLLDYAIDKTVPIVTVQKALAQIIHEA